jgi:hypothetical protein
MVQLLPSSRQCRGGSLVALVTWSSDAPRPGVGAGWACPCFLPEGAVVVSGVKAGPAGSSPQAMRSSLEAGGAAPYPCAARPLAWSAAALGVSGGVAATFWSWRARPGGGGLVLAGAAPGPVALAFQEQVVAGVEDPVKDGLADDRVGEQRVPV